MKLENLNAYVLDLVTKDAATDGAMLRIFGISTLLMELETLLENFADGIGKPVLSKTHAATIASAFPLMTIFARAFGGIASDYLSTKLSLTGRMMVQCACLAFEDVYPQEEYSLQCHLGKLNQHLLSLLSSLFFNHVHERMLLTVWNLSFPRSIPV